MPTKEQVEPSKMRSYIIWLNSGGSISGEAELAALEDFSRTWQQGEARILTLWDKNGRATVMMNTIQAIAINEIDENKAIGF